jgi:amino acid permease
VDVIEDPDVLESFYTQEWFIVLVVALFETPLTLASKIEKLKFMGLWGVVGIILYMLTFVVFYILCLVDDSIGNEPVGGMRMFPEDWFGAAAAVPNIFFAITFQNNFFPVFKGMQNPSDSKMARVAFAAVMFCASSYLLVGVLGYSYVGEAVKANFLESFDYKLMSKPFFFLLNATFLLSIFFAFPIMFFGCRNNFIALVKLAVAKSVKKEKEVAWRGEDTIEEISTYIRDQRYTERKKKARLHFMGYTLLIYAVMVMVSLLVSDIEIVFNAIGGICTSSLAPLLPCYFYFRLVVRKKQPRTFKFYAAIVVFAVMAPYSLFSVISLYINRD